MAYQLRTRPPTGCVPWPLILLEGGEKTGKTWLCALLSACRRIGQMYWIDLAEGSGDEYGAIPGVRYEMVEHDGTFNEIYAAVAELHAIGTKALAAGEPPIALTVDPMGSEWELLKGWANNRARRTRANRRKLADDPNAEIKVPQNCWNDANERHRKLMALLKSFPGVVLMTARGKEVSVIGEDGNPVEGKKDYRVEAQKNLGFDSSCWIRLDRNKPSVIVGARSVFCQVRPGYDEPMRLPRDWTLENVIFDILKCDPATSHVRNVVELKPDTGDIVSPRAIAISEAVADATTEDDLRAWWSRIAPALKDEEIAQYEADILADMIRARKDAIEATATSQTREAVSA